MIENGKTNKSGNSVIKPSIVKHYSTHMGSVDRVDQQRHGIQVLRKLISGIRSSSFVS